MKSRERLDRQNKWRIPRNQPGERPASNEAGGKASIGGTGY